MNLQFRIGQIIRICSRFFQTKLKDDNRKTSDFKVMFFCGETGIPYLNKSLLSIYKSWKTLPEILIFTDGAVPEKILKNIVNWPKKINIKIWEEAANYYKLKGNQQLYNYAVNEIWGKKFVSVLYASEKFRILYSDTDVLWFKEPEIKTDELNKCSSMKMMLDIKHCYDEKFIAQLQIKEEMYTNKPLNAGVIYASGDFSNFPKWKDLCNYLYNNNEPHLTNRHEQTSFAILNNYFGSEWSKNEIFLEVDDINEFYPLKYKKEYKSFFARHYVNTKSWLFWRDYLLFFI